MCRVCDHTVYVRIRLSNTGICSCKPVYLCLKTRTEELKYCGGICRYMNVVEAMRPDWYEVLCDADTSPDASKKRLSKSTTMSKSYLTQCLNLHKESKVMFSDGHAVDSNVIFL